MEGLLPTLLNLISSWDNSFPRKRSADRAKAMCISLLMTIGRKLFTRALCASGRSQADWSADYRLFSRCRWSPCALFRPILQNACKHVNESLIAVAFDDTLIRKTGKKIKGSSWQKDPLSPHFCCNFVRGIRYLQASVLLPLYNCKESKPCRAIPVQFSQLPKFKKPRKTDPDEKWQAYYKLTRKFNASTEFVKQMRYLRHELDIAGQNGKPMLAVVDASYINQTCLRAEIPNVSIIGRTRKNAKIHFRSQESGRRFYSQQSFAPEELRKIDQYPYKKTSAHYAGEHRQIFYKDFSEVFWKSVTKRKPLRLIILSPTPYRRSQKSKIEYREPAYLFTTNFELDAQTLIQKYLDRWQIEVNFREEKEQMTVGKQQVWSERSIPRAPAFVVACYAALVLAGVLHFSDCRQHEAFEMLPKWRNKRPVRPSIKDLSTVLRRELFEKVEFAMDGPRISFEKSVVISSAAA
jgi:DDE superfamily endonuclease